MPDSGAVLDEKSCIVLKPMKFDEDRSVESNDIGDLSNSRASVEDSYVSPFASKSATTTGNPPATAGTSTPSASPKELLDKTDRSTMRIGQETIGSTNRNRPKLTRRKCQRKVPIPSARDEATTTVSGQTAISSPSTTTGNPPATAGTSTPPTSPKAVVDTTDRSTMSSGQETMGSPNQNRLNFTRRKYHRKVPIPSARDEATVSELLPFECELCGKRLERARTLMLHKRAVHEGYRPFACEFCNARFTQNGHLKQHIEAVHKGSRPYGCKLCHRRFSTPRSAKEHRCDRKARRPAFGCGLCPARFREGVDLHEHRLRVHAGEQTFDCSVCGAPFRTENELSEHRASTHELKRPHVCELCGKSFTQANKLFNHKSAVHEGRRPYVCDTCGSAFTQLVHLKLHKNSIHEGKRPYKCTACFRSFSQSGHLRVHKCVVDRAVPFYVCDICNKRFPQMNTLKKHIASVHEKLRPFPCDLCSGAFRDATELRRHHRHVHSGKAARKCPFCHFQCHRPAEMRAHKLTLHSGARLRKCRYCRATFPTVAELKKHLADAHPAIQCRRRCRLCKQRFDTMLELRQHQLATHPARKIYGCEACDAIFASKEQVNQHMTELHPTPEAHTCTICGERFSRANTLTRHITVTHTDQKLICSQCGLRFFTVMALRKHERNSHENIGPHECEICGERFRFQGHLKRHHNKVHVAKSARASSSSHSNGDIRAPPDSVTNTTASQSACASSSPPLQPLNLSTSTKPKKQQQHVTRPNSRAPRSRPSSAKCLSSNPVDRSSSVRKRIRGRPRKSSELKSVDTVPIASSVALPIPCPLDSMPTYSPVAPSISGPPSLSIFAPPIQQPVPLGTDPLSQLGPWFPLCPLPFPNPTMNPLLDPFRHINCPTPAHPSATDLATTLALLSALSGSAAVPHLPPLTPAPCVCPQDLSTAGALITTNENSSYDGSGDNMAFPAVDHGMQDLSVGTCANGPVIKLSSSPTPSPKLNEPAEDSQITVEFKLKPDIP